MTAHKFSPVEEPPTKPATAAGESAAAVADRPTPVPLFAHESEREFARILDFYGIQWQYEPRTFPVRWDATGRAIESFTPDFYLPELDQFIELTTLRQSLVTKKNRKLRLVRELYPDINIKLLYNRDLRSLMAKYSAPRPSFGAERVVGGPDRNTEAGVK